MTREPKAEQWDNPAPPSSVYQGANLVSSGTIPHSLHVTKLQTVSGTPYSSVPNFLPRMRWAIQEHQSDMITLQKFITVKPHTVRNNSGPLQRWSAGRAVPSRGWHWDETRGLHHSLLPLKCLWLRGPAAPTLGQEFHSARAVTLWITRMSTQGYLRVLSDFELKQEE